MAKVDLKMSSAGFDELLAQANQAMAQFTEMQKAWGQELDNLEKSLAGLSKNAYINKSKASKAGLISQHNILVDIKNTGSAAKKALQEMDAQISAEINAGI